MPSRVLLLKTPMARRAAKLESSMMNVIICVYIFEGGGGYSRHGTEWASSTDGLRSRFRKY
jgi:hypothetical protein